MNSLGPQQVLLADSYEDIYAQARSRYLAGQIDDAVSLYQRLVNRLGRLTDRVRVLRPELVELLEAARLDLTSALYQLGRYAEAIEVLEALIAQEPKGVEQLKRDHAVLRIHKGEADAGLAELRACAEASPDDPMGWLALANEARVEGRLAESQAAVEHVLQAARAQRNEETLAQAEYQHFLLSKEMGRIDEAIAAWEEARRHDSNVAKTVREVYEMLTEAGRYSEALAYVARDENKLQAGFQRGIIANATARPIDARDAWREVAAMDPDTFEYGHDAWLESVLRLRDPGPAIEWLERVLPEAGTARVLFLAGVAWAMRGDKELAAMMLQQANRLSSRERPSKKKLDSADWRLLNLLVADDEVKQALRPYFAVVETIWGV